VNKIYFSQLPITDCGALLTKGVYAPYYAATAERCL